MKVSFEGAFERVLSFKNDGAEAGDLVKMKSDGCVETCDAGDRFIGVCIYADSDFAVVKLGGYVELGYSGTAPSVGYNKLVATATGKVKIDNNEGAEYLAITLNTTAAKVGIII